MCPSNWCLAPMPLTRVDIGVGGVTFVGWWVVSGQLYMKRWCEGMKSWGFLYSKLVCVCVDLYLGICLYDSFLWYHMACGCKKMCWFSISRWMEFQKQDHKSVSKCYPTFPWRCSLYRPKCRGLAWYESAIFRSFARKNRKPKNHVGNCGQCKIPLKQWVSPCVSMVYIIPLIETISYTLYEQGDMVLVREAKLLGKILISQHLVAKFSYLIPTWM